jgi:hypothetical protein
MHYKHGAVGHSSPFRINRLDAHPEAWETLPCSGPENAVRNG